MGLLRTLVVAFLAANALFWGLWPHGAHCRVAGALGVRRCPPHWVHLLTGALSFLGALLVAQWGYLTHAM